MPVERKNILIFPAGSEIGLEIFNSLKFNIHVNVFGASGKPDHARFVYSADRYDEGDYYIGSPQFLNKINELLERWDISYVYPTHDSIVLWLAEHQEFLKAKVIGSPAETTRVARYKKLIYEVFKDANFCPKVYSEKRQPDEFPVFLKPDDGQGGNGSCLARGFAELDKILNEHPALVVTEFLPGEELSVDCFTDRHRRLRFIGPRTRERVTIGISYESESVPLSKDIEDIANEINSRVTLRGAWFFQIKRDKAGNWKLLEFAARQSSTMGLFRQVGVNFALLSLFDAMDLDVEIVSNPLRAKLSRSLKNRYKLDYGYKKVFLDFDETVVIENRVNTLAMAFIYQCLNQNIPIVLLTKHRHDIITSLMHYSIDPSLFEDIVVLKENEEKHEFIDGGESIFIDNYFFDRMKVSRHCKIPVFDVDAIESLVNE
jgi:hypothetical protein